MEGQGRTEGGLNGKLSGRRKSKRNVPPLYGPFDCTTVDHHLPHLDLICNSAYRRLHLALPVTLRYFRPRKLARKVANKYWRWAAHQLRLTSYMFGERRPTEELASNSADERGAEGNGKGVRVELAGAVDLGSRVVETESLSR